MSRYLFATLLVFVLQLPAPAFAEEAKTSAFQKGQVLSVIKVATSKEEADAFVKAFSEGPKASHKMPGFLGLAVAENTKEAGSFIVISLWKDEDALNNYVKSKAYGEDHARLGEIKTAKPEAPGRFKIKDN